MCQILVLPLLRLSCSGSIGILLAVCKISCYKINCNRKISRLLCLHSGCCTRLKIIQLCSLMSYYFVSLLLQLSQMLHGHFILTRKPPSRGRTDTHHHAQPARVQCKCAPVSLSICSWLADHAHRHWPASH